MMRLPFSVLCGECLVVAGPGDGTAGQPHCEGRTRLPGEWRGGGHDLQETGVEEGAGQAESGPSREDCLLALTTGGGQPQAGRQHLHPHHDVLLGEGLDGADVGPGVGHGDGVDDEDPVVGWLVEDGVPVVPGEGEVAHGQEVQGVVPGDGPRDEGGLPQEVVEVSVVIELKCFDGRGQTHICIVRDSCNQTFMTDKQNLETSNSTATADFSHCFLQNLIFIVYSLQSKQ